MTNERPRERSRSGSHAVALLDACVARSRLVCRRDLQAGSKGAAPASLGNINLAKLKEAVMSIRGSNKVTSRNPEVSYEALKQYSRDLTAAAAEGKLDPVIGRDEEIRRAIQILSRRTKNNPILLGEATNQLRSNSSVGKLAEYILLFCLVHIIT